jgi:hypothetical protein
VRAASLRVVRPGDVGEPEPEQAPPTMGSLRQRHGLLRAEIVAGNRKAVERQHSLGKRTARERLELLLDPDSFTELGILDNAISWRAGKFGIPLPFYRQFSDTLCWALIFRSAEPINR